MAEKRKFVFIDVGHETDIVLRERLRSIAAECDLEMETLNDSDDDFIEQFNSNVCQRLDEVAALGSTNLYMFKYTTSDGKYLHQFCDLPIIVQSMDNPARVMHDGAKDDDKVISVFNSPSHEKIWTKYMGGKGKTFIDGTLPQTRPMADLTYEAYAARKPEILLAANIHHFDQTLDRLWKWIVDCADDPRLLGMTAVDAMITNENMSALEAVEGAQRIHAVEIDNNTLLEVFEWVEAYVKVWRREYVLRALIEGPVTVSTPHIPPYFWPRHRDKFVRTIGPETLALCSEYRAIINTNPPFPGCVHDRVINSIESGALLFSDCGMGIEQILTPYVDFVPYNYTDNNLAELVEHYLNNPRESYEMILSARKAWATSPMPGHGYKQALEHALALRDA